MNIKNKTPEYFAWMGMKNRCLNPKAQGFRYWGGRGIKICDRWMVYENFLEDMGPRPTPKHSLDRINNNGDYEPSNCRWATIDEQNRNKRTNIWMTFRGKTMLPIDWSKELGICIETLEGRLRRGWSHEKTLSTPVLDHSEVSRGESNGRAKLTEKDVSTIRDLLNTGLSQREIGERFGVTQVMVSRIKLRIAWSHV